MKLLPVLGMAGVFLCVNHICAQDLRATAATMTLGSNRVSLTISGGQRLIVANGLPDHVPGQFPNQGNPNRIASQDYQFRVPTAPKVNAQTTPSRGAWFGVALNGVPFEPGTGEFWNGQHEWNYEAKSGFIDLGLDAHNAHVQPTGAYHYHGLPAGLIKRLGGDGVKMRLVGWAADGFPIYTSYAPTVATNAASPLKRMRSSWRLKSGARTGGPGGPYDGRFTADYEFARGSGDLDEGNGRFGLTPEFPQGTYYYCITEEFPQLARAWRGTPDASFFKRGPGPGPGPGGGPGRDRRGPGFEARGPGGFPPPPPERF